VEAAVRGLQPGDKWEIEDSHYDKLKLAVEEPVGDMNNMVRYQLLPFQSAIVEATRG
jgi:hypothetical protein